MSMHKIPLTIIEEGGLKAHGLAIGKPSQLSDAFRQGVAWAFDNLPVSKNPYGYVREIRPGEWKFSKTCLWGPEVWTPVFLHKEEGQNCADCLDTGWLENREDGKYPCTCVTETEPYQLLKAELDTYRDIIQTNVCRVYMAVTDDKCSIENTDASVVIALFEDYLTECVEKETKPLKDEIENLNSKLQIDNTIIGDFDARCKELELKIEKLNEDVEHYKSEAHDASMSRVQIGKLQEHIAKLKTPPVLSQWIRDLELEIRASPMNYVFTFPRDKTLELMGISMEVQAAFHALKTENESLAPIKEALVKAKLALDSCDVNDTQFPLDTQYYDRELVDEAIAVIEKLPK